MMERLKKRRDFLAAAKGRKAHRHHILVEMRERQDANPPRVGFTVTKRTARRAVERNRIRRRLKEAARITSGVEFQPGCDYVLVGRQSAVRASFAEIEAQLASALRHLASKTQRGAVSPEKSSR
jgi:ribonuclease P protein component